MLKRIISVVLVIIWMSVIFMFSNMNGDSSGNSSKGTIKFVIYNTVNILNLDINNSDIDKISEDLNVPLRKVMHMSVYFVLSLLIINCYSVNIIDRKNILYVTFLICLIYSISDEFHQTFISGRAGQVKDVIIDMFGVCISFIVYKIYKKYCLKNDNIW